MTVSDMPTTPPTALVITWPNLVRLPDLESRSTRSYGACLVVNELSITNKEKSSSEEQAVQSASLQSNHYCRIDKTAFSDELVFLEAP